MCIVFLGQSFCKLLFIHRIRCWGVTGTFCAMVCASRICSVGAKSACPLTMGIFLNVGLGCVFFGNGFVLAADGGGGGGGAILDLGAATGIIATSMTMGRAAEVCLAGNRNHIKPNPCTNTTKIDTAMIS
jgi:hypothetical protein